MNRVLLLSVGVALALMSGTGRQVLAQQKVAKKPSRSAVPAAVSAEEALAEASETGRFTFLLFYKEDSPAVRQMQQVVKEGVAARSDRTLFALAPVLDPATAPLVERFSLSRSPLPLTLAVAPNGAITGIFSKQIQDEDLDTALVTPTMTKCMKLLQSNKLVFVCVRSAPKAAVPACVKQLQADPDFKDRVSLVSMQASDPNEDRFFQQMKLDPDSVEGAVAVLIAPPGMLIGKYDASATADEVTTALYKAGKCCDDPNCKHNKEKEGAAGPQAKKPGPATRGSR